jgi:glycosyltransferase involved in cell wall biosynthesis
VIIEYSNRLTARGHHCTLVAPGGTVDAELRDELSERVELRESSMPLRDGMSKLELLRLSHSLAAAAPHSDIIMSTHTPTVVAGFISARMMGKGRLAWFYQDYAAMFDQRPVERFLMDNALRWHEVAYVNTEWAGDHIRAQDPARVFFTGVGQHHADALFPLFFEDRNPADLGVVLSMADARPRKGMADFLAAAEIVAQEFPNLRLAFYGKEPCPIETSLPYTFKLRPSHEELTDMLQRCGLFVLASHWESLGSPPLEAMACGTPVVMADSGGVRDYGVHGANCLMVPPQEPVQLAEAMAQVLRDPELARTFSHAGPATAARYDWELLTDRFADQLRSFVASPRRSLLRTATART